ncbi:MAG: nucleoside-diphosphate sugar epimerase/dehydratase [Chloroflexota bacterium]
MKNWKKFGLVRNRHLFIGDLVLVVFSVLFSFVLRLELGPLSLFIYYLPQALWMVAIALLIKLLVYSLFGLYRRLWVYASIQELKLIAVAVTVASLLVTLGVASLWWLDVFTGPVFHGFPRSALVIDWMLSLLFVGGLRFVLRMFAERYEADSGQLVGGKLRVLIVGAGDAGNIVVREMQKNPQLRLMPVGFLDDDPQKQKHQMHGVPVVGMLKDLAAVLARKRIDEVIIAIPTAPGKVVRQVTDVCREKGVHFRTMPGIYELLDGKVSVSRLRKVDITDLLRREPVKIDEKLIGSQLGGRRVLVTGAGGSIGSELCRQIARWGPAELVLLGHGENSIFEVVLEFEESYPSLPVYPLIADVRDELRFQSVMKKFNPQFVFHAAAHKHVPMMETNVEEAVLNNVLGTRCVVDSCLACDDVERLVLISTDKAVRPTSVMGGTKRIAEMLVLDAADRSHRTFVVVRFGNVLGSRGSVVPLFERQIAKGGPVTVTHPEMMRYFMTIPEAVHLVLQASVMGKGGETFILDMGDQIRVLDLAEDLIRLSGLEPGRDIDIVFTGIRPGEKLCETLWDVDKVYQPTPHPDIFVLNGEEPLDGAKLHQSVDELVRLAREGEAQTIINMLDELIPNAAISSTPPMELTAVI